MLSVSYIVTELFLLGLNVIMTENENLKTQISTNPTHTSAPSYENTQESEENKPEDSISEVQRQLLLNLERLTKTERIIYLKSLKLEKRAIYIKKIAIKSLNIKFKAIY